ncbi:MAG: hypothetical protein IKG04_08890 [Exiguobacterium sp.]|nr:hypothetical protein [Exiguobacterium sp.]
MQLKLTFEDGSSAFLAHHGVKGMKWGVWNSETSSRYRDGSSRSNQRYLNKLDADMRALTVQRANTAQAKDYYTKRANKAEIAGKNDRARKFKNLADIESKKLNTITKMQKQAGKEMINTLNKVEKSGQSWKVSNYDFVSPGVMRSSRLSKALKKEHGKSGVTSSFMNVANTSNSNRFTVRDSSKLSEKKAKIWKANKHDVKRYTPQKYEVHYVYV